MRQQWWSVRRRVTQVQEGATRRPSTHRQAALTAAGALHASQPPPPFTPFPPRGGLHQPCPRTRQGTCIPRGRARTLWDSSSPPRRRSHFDSCLQCQGRGEGGGEREEGGDRGRGSPTHLRTK
jgi:hypothetical protein